MPKEDTLPKTKKTSKKFLFDQYNFDEGPVSLEPEPEEEPPPSFSEDELAKAKQTSFDQGKKTGLQESENSREKYVADLLAKIETHFSTLFDQEQQRNNLYEAEVLQLCRILFERAFPMLNESHGLDEVVQTVESVLKRQAEQPEIIIEVCADYVVHIEKHLENLKQSEGLSGAYTVKANDTLGPGDCRMAWKDGGAQRNAANLSEQILQHLKEILADKPILHNNGNKDMDENDQSVASEEDNVPQDPETEQDNE